MTELLEEQNNDPKLNKRKHKIKVENYSPHLFWDVDKTKLNLDKRKEFLVGRVLGYGLIRDWNQLVTDLGLECIVSIALNLRELDPIDLNFVSFLSGIDEKCFRSYTTIQLNRIHWVY